MSASKKERILLAVSGGIDSAVAIHLLQQRGFAVRGVHFNFWHWENNYLHETKTVLKDLADRFNITIETVDQRQFFKHEVVEPLVDAQISGATPNPCVRCNPMVKFRLLKEMADADGIKCFSTGHYARVEFDAHQNRYLLKTGVDATKDQSYMLCFLSQGILSRVVFPLGEFSKREIYEIGKGYGLPIDESDESQDLCFVKPENYRDFLQSAIGEPAPGPILNANGEVLGTHDGLIFYTIGQRKGIKVSSHRPYYVLRKDPKTNSLVVGYVEDLDRLSFEMVEPNWIFHLPEFPLQTEVKIRYQSSRIPCEVKRIEKDRYSISLGKPLRGITPGQYAVFYQNDYVLGGGKIDR